VTVPRLTTQPPLPPSVHLRRAEGSLPWPLGIEGTTLHQRARQGLWHGLRALGLGNGDEILVPAWQHGSEVEAIERAGCRVILFDVDRSTTAPDGSQLEALMTPRTRALYLIHYLGWPHDAPRWKAWCDERSLFLIEDCAQAFMSSNGTVPLGSTGAMSIFCIYKTVGIPDGAALHCTTPASVPHSTAARGVKELLRAEAEWLLQSRNLAASLRRPRRDAGYGSADFDLGDPGAPPASAGVNLMPKLVTGDIRERRRQNFHALAARLGDITPPSFRTLPDGASPLVYPVAVDDKPRYLQRLAERGVIGLNLWAVPHARIAENDLPEARWLREHVVGLPVHQELKRHHVEHIAKTASEVESG
jgi:dTDP-4-amino-4,6-dideoxygalactose transaminase